MGGDSRMEQVPECKWEEAAGQDFLFVNARSVELQGKHYRTFIFLIQIYKTSLLLDLEKQKKKH